MKIETKNLQALKMPLSVLLLVLIIGVPLIRYTQQQVTAARAALAQQQEQLSQADKRLRTSGDELKGIERYLAEYQQLEAQGIVGPEQRINWLDGLASTNQLAELFGVAYQVSAQQPYPYAAELKPGKVSLRNSLMHVTLRLVHEADLLRFFDLLESQKVGLFSVDRCVMEKISAIGKTLAYQPYLQADCDLAWITIYAEPAEGKS